ncbi:MAG: hypothetical protein ABT16_00250 [Rhodanobacter sp. SCN 65-17]|nr:MAG: hypothetical protein ABT16_00250 [Rhodanobacter sp. SCN 65-17]
MSKQKIRVGVAGHDLKFWMPLQDALEATGHFEFRHDLWGGHETHDEASSKALLAWADVLVAEWALGNAVYYSKNKRPNQRLFVRLHQQERRTQSPAHIDYRNVEKMIFVGPHILQDCVEKFPIPKEICTVIANFVDVSRYDHPKLGGTDYTLGMIGINPAMKRLDLAVDTLEILSGKDDRYTLRVKGRNPASIGWLWARTAEREYYTDLYHRINSGALRHRVIFDPAGPDVQHWLKMVGCILSPSDFESFHMALAEGAASGALPVVWNWEGAGQLYPEFPLVSDPQEAAEQIEFFNKSSAGRRYRRQVKDVIRRRYDASLIAEQWGTLLGERKSEPRRVPAARRKRSLLVIWAIDRWETFHRREMIQALAANLQDTHDILVIEPGSHFQTVAKLGWDSEGMLLDNLRGQLQDCGEGIFRTRLFTGGIPAASRKASYQGASDPLDVLDGLIAAEFGKGVTVLHWVYKPDQALRLRKSDRFIYEVYDDYTMDFGTGKPNTGVAKAEREALALAQHVFFTSEPLHSRKAAGARSASIVGNGVAYDAFAVCRVPHVASVGRPVAGYLGNLSVFFDWQLMLEVCSAMPEIDFVFHGQIELASDDPNCAIKERMGQLKNVRFTGRVSRESGASAIARYDVLLIPFVVNDAMHAVNPLKLWEYYAVGAPVVHTPMEAIRESVPAGLVASGVQEWIAAIRQALQPPMSDAASAELRIERAREHRWEALTVAHAEIVRRLERGPLHLSQNASVAGSSVR